MRCSAQKRQRQIDQEQRAEDERQKERDVRQTFSPLQLAHIAGHVDAATLYAHGATGIVCSMLSRHFIAAEQELKRKLWGGK
jgi:hypothetical protein